MSLDVSRLSIGSSEVRRVTNSSKSFVFKQFCCRDDCLSKVCQYSVKFFICVTGGEKSNLNLHSNPVPLAYRVSALTNELFRPDVLTYSHTSGYPMIQARINFKDLVLVLFPKHIHVLFTTYYSSRNSPSLSSKIQDKFNYKF